MTKKSITTLILLAMVAFTPIAQAINNPMLPVNEPEITAITTTSATVSVPQAMLNTMTEDIQSGIYFEYIPTQQVCIMIYPTPENCLPKKTVRGQTTFTLTGLTSNTSYTVTYKKDNTIACVTTPCPGNGLQSGSREFVTTHSTATPPSYTFSRNLMVGSRGSDVIMLQDILRAHGYFNMESTGYFGAITWRSVRAFQSSYMHIIPTGFVGVKTRAVLNSINTPVATTTEEYFSGVIQSASTGCYADGICSVTIDGKTIVTTVGWSREVVGSIRGTVNNIGDIQTSKIGAKASVYAKKTADGYTLYGNSAYYIDVQ